MQNSFAGLHRFGHTKIQMVVYDVDGKERERPSQIAVIPFVLLWIAILWGFGFSWIDFFKTITLFCSQIAMLAITMMLSGITTVQAIMIVQEMRKKFFR